jgi:hypothetical protein
LFTVRFPAAPPAVEEGAAPGSSEASLERPHAEAGFA